ncbi:MAG: DMT family transporter [Candidatus Uhrbacteria bacterium]
MGIFWAFVAMFSWGLGDFLIQKSTRKLGNGVALFCITAFATVLLFPFIVQELPYLALVDYRFWLLLAASIVILIASLFDFEALRIGKISVVEPIYALEVPLTVALGSFFLSEWLTPIQGLFTTILITGIIFVSLESLRVFRHFHLEKGVFLAITATIVMSSANFLFGVGARHTSPLLINWFTSAFIAIALAGYLTYSHQWKALKKSWQKQKGLILGVSIADNIAWIAFTFSTLTIPIAISTGISESYIALAAGLGLIVNKEKLATHQKIGLVCVIISAIALAFVSNT